MTSDIDKVLDELIAIREVLPDAFWISPEFWITSIIGTASVLFSILAFLEARKAKAAATEAGRTVKMQTITIELTELSQRLDKLRMEIQFNEARDMINELSRKLRRLVSPFQDDPGLSETISSLKDALLSAKNSLNDVRPTDETADDQALHTVYYAIEGDLATINGLVADLLGLFEKRTIETGDNHANA